MRETGTGPIETEDRVNVSLKRELAIAPHGTIGLSSSGFSWNGAQSDEAGDVNSPSS